MTNTSLGLLCNALHSYLAFDDFSARLAMLERAIANGRSHCLESDVHRVELFRLTLRFFRRRIDGVVIYFFLFRLQIFFVLKTESCSSPKKTLNAGGPNRKQQHIFLQYPITSETWYDGPV